MTRKQWKKIETKWQQKALTEYNWAKHLKNCQPVFLTENKFKSHSINLYPQVSKFRLSRCLCHRSIFVLILIWYGTWHHYVCNDHWHNYFLKLYQVARASAQSIFLRCLWFLQSSFLCFLFFFLEMTKYNNIC